MLSEGRIAFPHLNKEVKLMCIYSFEKLRRTAVLDLLPSGIAPASWDLKELFHMTSACPLILILDKVSIKMHVGSHCRQMMENLASFLHSNFRGNLFADLLSQICQAFSGF